MSARTDHQVKRAAAIDYIINLDSSEKELLKQQFIQYHCDFYNEHSESDRKWFGRNFDNCLEPIELHNRCMFQFMIPLFIISEMHKQQNKIPTLSK